MENPDRTFLERTYKRRRLQAAAADSRLSMLKELQCALESALFLIETASRGRRDIGDGIDFYEEVRTFEINLIKQALRKTNGSQVRAAAMLGLNTQTLNSKIKNFSIGYSNRQSHRADGRPSVAGK